MGPTHQLRALTGMTPQFGGSRWHPHWQLLICVKLKSLSLILINRVLPPMGQRARRRSRENSWTALERSGLSISPSFTKWQWHQVWHTYLHRADVVPIPNWTFCSWNTSLTSSSCLLTGPQLSISRFVAAVNWSGIFFMDGRDRKLLELSYLEVNEVKTLRYWTFWKMTISFNAHGTL